MISTTFSVSVFDSTKLFPFIPLGAPSFPQECADMISRAAYQMGVTPEDLLETLKDGGLVNLFDLAAKKTEEKKSPPST